jgi:hypothetical protein
MFSESSSSSSANGAVLFFTGFLLLVVLVPPCVVCVLRLLCVAADATRCFSTVQSKSFLAFLDAREVGFFAWTIVSNSEKKESASRPDYTTVVDIAAAAEV